MEVKRRREKVKRQASMLNRLTRQLSMNEARASSATGESGESGKISDFSHHTSYFGICIGTQLICESHFLWQACLLEMLYTHYHT